MAADVIESIISKEIRTEKFGLGLTPIARQTTVADATDAASVILRCNEIIDRLQAAGLID